MSVSNYFKNLRKTYGLTQQKLAEELKCSLTAIKDLESSKTAFPSTNLLNNLSNSKYVDNKDLAEICSDIMFNEESDIGYNLDKIYKRYFASRKYGLYHIEIDYQYKKIDGSTDNFLGLVWVPHLSYYKMIIAKYNRNIFLNALNNLNKNPDALRHAIISETKFFDEIKNNTDYKCIRFLLDKYNKDDLKIFKEISKLKMKNIGKYASISFQLVNSKSGSYNEDKDIYIVTDHKLNILMH